MAVIGVDEHVWRHARRGDKYVTVIIDLTPVRDGSGPARLLDMIEGRSKQAFQDWLADRPNQWRDRVEVVTMDGFSGFKTASAEELPEAAAVMDPFHVVRLAGNALDECRRRVQPTTCGHRGRKTDPLYRSRRRRFDSSPGWSWHDRVVMTETPESRTEPTAVATEQGRGELSPGSDRPNRLAQSAAWVGIVAGVVFIVAVVFFSGFFVGRQYGSGYRDGRGMYYPGGMMGPGSSGPGMMAPGQQLSPTTTPAVPTAPPR